MTDQPFRLSAGKEAVATALTRLGVDLSEDGKHWKAIFQGDARYTFPKTGGDNRGGLNMVRDVNNALF